ncbi:nucleotidyltransferase domain-containing protein [Roseospira goensis]|nr:nucleotidyltransferase domain-containing protein [Roseospira goensis]
MRARIRSRLQEVERTEDVRVLFAAESGSRAWGFPSPDSDYDVRFIYARPLRWYLGLDPGRDVIEAPLDAHLIDLAGWDVRKALRLLLKTNPALSEWLRSPIVYEDSGTFQTEARALFDRHAAPRTLAHAYASTAATNWRSGLADRETVRLKKYFYAIRPCLCLRWVVETGAPPPMALDALMAGLNVPAPVRAAIEDLKKAKSRTNELGTGPRIAALDHWIRDVLDDPQWQRWAAPGPEQQSRTRREAEHLFHTIIGAA